MNCQPETFWTLFHNLAHWEFELFLMLIFDVIIGMIAWPFIKKHWNHHTTHDEIHYLEHKGASK